MKIILLEPRGFCAGVERAVSILESSVRFYGKPLYAYHDIVHNRMVVQSFIDMGVVFIEDINLVPKGSNIVISAHGVSDKVLHDSKMRNINVIDATCPLVLKVHNEAIRYVSQGKHVVIVGHKNHPEIIGTAGKIPKECYTIIESVRDIDLIKEKDGRKLAYITQTTFSMNDVKDIIEELDKRFVGITGPNLKDICYATQNRQNAVHSIIDNIDMLIVVGGENSSNSNRLLEIGKRKNIKHKLVNEKTEITSMMFENVNTIGITAGASTPEEEVNVIIEKIKMIDPTCTTEIVTHVKENIVFKLPEIGVVT